MYRGFCSVCMSPAEARGVRQVAGDKYLLCVECDELVTEVADERGDADVEALHQIHHVMIAATTAEGRSTPGATSVVVLDWNAIVDRYQAVAPRRTSRPAHDHAGVVPPDPATHQHGLEALSQERVVHLQEQIRHYVGNAVIASLRLGGPETIEEILDLDNFHEKLEHDPNVAQTRGFIFGIAEALGVSRPGSWTSTPAR